MPVPEAANSCRTERFRAGASEVVRLPSEVPGRPSEPDRWMLRVYANAPAPAIFASHRSARVSLKALLPGGERLGKVEGHAGVEFGCSWRELRTSKRETLLTLRAVNESSSLPLPSCSALVDGLV